MGSYVHFFYIGIWEALKDRNFHEVVLIWG
jgi:hypothetical protein